MKNAPFSISIILLILYVGSVVAGAFLGSWIGGMGFQSIFAGALCGFLPLPLASLTRRILSGFFASAAGASEQMPYAFSAPVRYTLGAVISAIVAYLVLSLSGMGLTFLSGLVIAILTSAIFSTIMVVRTATLD